MCIFSKLSRFSLVYGAALLLLTCILSSCGSTRPYTYIQGQFDTTRLSQVKVTDPVIQKGDLVSIIVYSDNPDATKIYNQTQIASMSATSSPSNSGSSSEPTPGGVTGSSPTSSGYLVDENGNIEFQGLGLLHIEGLTRRQLKDLLDSKLKEFLKNPYYNIRFLNNRFTILGEIVRPGIYNIPSEHVNLFEALGLAGDMTFYGRRDNILVIREQNGKREFGRIDITKPEVMTSSFFYLQQNDIVIVEQNKKKASASDQVTTRNIAIITSIVSTLAIMYSIFRN